jgi:hypothetical protein
MSKEQDNSSTKEEKSNFNERIVRWETHRINFLSFVINLILTLTGGSLVFWYSVLKDARADFCSLLLSFAGIMLASSFLLGIVTMLNRLEDFRQTVEKIRKREELSELGSEDEANQDSKQNSLKAEIKELENQTRRLGARTYDLLYIQVGLFGLGNLVVFLCILLA